MSIEAWLQQATTTLKTARINTAHLDALVLLEDAINQDRAWIFAHTDTPITRGTLEGLNKRILQRADHMPLAYIRGKSEFYGREFLVTPATLQPRPETETMIDLLKSLPLTEGCIIVDVGTGSGAIAITTKLELTHAIVHGVEIQADALAIAQKNSRKLNADVLLHEGNLLEPVLHLSVDIILANLPYVPDGHTINEAAMQEPAVALFGGEDGLDLYRKLFIQITTMKHKHQPLYILTESLPFQHKELRRIAKNHDYTLTESRDFIQVFERNR